MREWHLRRPPQARMEQRAEPAEERKVAGVAYGTGGRVGPHDEIEADRGEQLARRDDPKVLAVATFDSTDEGSVDPYSVRDIELAESAIHSRRAKLARDEAAELLPTEVSSLDDRRPARHGTSLRQPT